MCSQKALLDVAEIGRNEIEMVAASVRQLELRNRFACCLHAFRKCTDPN